MNGIFKDFRGSHLEGGGDGIVRLQCDDDRCINYLLHTFTRTEDMADQVESAWLVASDHEHVYEEVTND